MTAKRRLVTPRPRFTRIEVNGRLLSAYTKGGAWRPVPPGVPPTVRVFGDPWTILAHTQIYAAKANGSRCAGMCFGFERIILIEPDQPELELRNTLYHELCHSHFRAFAERDKRIASVDRDTEEAVCNLVAAWLSGSG